MTTQPNIFLTEATVLFPYSREIRRDLHRNPEIGFQEVRTAAIIAKELTALGLEVTTGLGGTGVVALLEGGKPGPVVLLRFDMDALPVQEETGAEYASLNPGVMHACGHDGHVAIGLTVARLLKARLPEISGTIKFVFQPAEEGLGGAERIIADGVLRNPPPDFCLAMHLWNEKPLGWIGVTAGPVMARADLFTIHITGKGGHGGMPEKAHDPIVTAALLVNALQNIVSRNVPPMESAVLSVTRIHGGETYNVIPPQVELAGSIRTYDQATRDRVINRMQQQVEFICQAMECSGELVIQPMTPAVVNDPGVTEHIQALVPQVLPSANLDTEYRTTGSEDMAFLMRDRHGCYFFVGSANPVKGLTFGHHHPRFDFDEAALTNAAALMAAAAFSFSQENPLD
ncbi:MAG TPA: amidohydrolase [Longilinea sp.]|nr:amidohydrolase [Longilinea sp.]